MSIPRNGIGFMIPPGRPIAVYAASEGRWSFEECRDTLARDTRRYAKRQYTWFNRDESISWFDRDDADEIFSYVEQNLSDCDQPSGK